MGVRLKKVAALNYLKALLPIWAIESVITGGVHALPMELPSLAGYALMAVSVLALPYFAGKRLERNGSKKSVAIVGAISISAVTLMVLSIFHAVEDWEVEVLYGATIATLIFGVPFQAFAGAYGWSNSRKSYMSAT